MGSTGRVVAQNYNIGSNVGIANMSSFVGSFSGATVIVNGSFTFNTPITTSITDCVFILEENSTLIVNNPVAITNSAFRGKDRLWRGFVLNAGNLIFSSNCLVSGAYN
jgi:hypothetical protein